MSDSEEFESAGEETAEVKKTPKKDVKAQPPKTVEQKKVPVVETSDTADGWDAEDDWGEEFSVEEKKPEKEQEDWSDFDDWGSKKNDAPAPAAPQMKSDYDTFPVLNDLSLESKYSSKVTQEKTPIKETIPETKEKIDNASSGWGWGTPWGGVVSSFISSATEGVSTITSHVSHGLSTVIENSIGIPEPEDLARMNKETEDLKQTEKVGNEIEKSNEIKDELQQNMFWNPKFRNLVTGVTGLGSKVINGGLDNLEGLGKKTLNILQENDTLLVKKNIMRIEGDKPNLSQVLREAKNKTEEIEKNLKQIQKKSYKKQLHFESLFDNYYGLVHLEALEMLSKQSSIKLQSLIEPLSGKALTELEETFNEVKELCDLGDMEADETDGSYDEKELSSKFIEAVEDLGVKIDFNDILKCWIASTSWLNENPTSEPLQVYEKGLHCLAETCALAIHKMHKIAEMLLIIEHHSTANEADSLVQLAQVFCFHINGIANRFGGKLNSFEKNEEVSSLITSIFVEVYNSTTYVQNAFQLLIPILQIGAA